MSKGARPQSASRGIVYRIFHQLTWTDKRQGRSRSHKQTRSNTSSQRQELDMAAGQPSMRLAPGDMIHLALDGLGVSVRDNICCLRLGFLQLLRRATHRVHTNFLFLLFFFSMVHGD